ncbi:MAG: class I SAM-dependent methyltransferase [Candidatus Aminicenantes bacterium]|nr:class I SAM-dependent methyltransferase [Candidatus Aminicenantes bacterium]
MKRTIETLAQTRRDLEEEFSKKIQELKERATALDLSSLAAVIAGILELQNSLTDAKDKEWDALASNHVGMIFKSMEWRVDKLAASYDDASLLIKKFVLLREQLDRLLAVLEEKKLPSSAQVKEIAGPLEDGLYTGFENRFRGSEEDIKRQQAPHLVHFRPGGKVLDLGCGRGEFLDLLKKNGFEGFGVDGNAQMVDLCLEKGLNGVKGDLLEVLSNWPDGSLDGIFSSQVIEHLSPAYLKKMVELSRAKLAPGGAILLETVNPTSVFALVHIYFLDLTHQRPVHPQALKFLLESSGFDGVEIKFSAELGEERLRTLPAADDTASLLNRDIDRLNDLLYAPANYAAIGRKAE